jgi:hypothetical protein
LQRSTLAERWPALAWPPLLIALWSLLRPYKGLTGDAELYGMQALSRLRPGLAQDLYLKYGSQDSFTIFSSLYARCIGGIGLTHAALALTILCSALFFGASWVLVRKLTDATTAYFAVALLIITVGSYGAYSVFHYSEDWLTARSLAEAMIALAIACHFCGWRNAGLGVALAAIFVHPLMALPGVLLLICLRVPPKVSLAGASLGVCAVLALALAAVSWATLRHYLPVMDAEWIDVVRERSKFLFLQMWSLRDWELTARPFLCLAITASAMRDERIRKLCVSAMVIGAAGLAVAYIAGGIGPVALLLQGQAWRWVWITAFVSCALVVPTLLAVWRNRTVGPPCALLVLAAWTFPLSDAAAFSAMAFFLWTSRDRLPQWAVVTFRCAAPILALVLVGWVMTKAAHLAMAAPSAAVAGPVWLAKCRAIFALEVPAMLLVGLFFLTIRRGRWPSQVASAVAVLAALAAGLGTYTSQSAEITSAERESMAAWRQAIPAGENVFVMPARNSAAFAWFALERPSYLSVDQSAGVVFSRETAREVRRRSMVLLPVLDPDWMLTSMLRRASAAHETPLGSSRPLTRDNLIGICNDPELGFVVSKDKVGFPMQTHTRKDRWQDWNLYDCRQVRAGGAAAASAASDATSDEKGLP